MKVVATVEARMSSTRLPGKTLLPLAGEPVLARVVERLRLATLVDEVVVATTVNPADDVLAEYCAGAGLGCFRGSEDDVLARVIGAAETAGAELIVQAGADCPLYDGEVIDDALRTYIADGVDYVANDWELTYPLGVTVHVVALSTLREVASLTTDPRHRENVVTYIWEHPERYRIVNRPAPPARHRPEYRLTLDYPEDYTVISSIYDTLHPANPKFGLDVIIGYLDAHPEIASLNRHCQQRVAGGKDKRGYRGERA